MDIIVETDLAYTAGFFDGEGCIRIYSDKKRNRYKLICSIGQKRLDILEWIQRCFGGSIYESKSRVTYYQWTIVAQQASAFIQEILPYLRLKVDEARLAIEFQSTRKKQGFGWTTTPLDIELSESQMLLLRALKI